MHPRGTATIEPGQYRLSHTRGLHRGAPAWVQVGRLLVRRDNDRDALLELEPSALVDDVTAANIHAVGDPDRLAGCIGAPKVHLDVLLAAYDRLHGRYPQPRVSLTLVEG